MKKITLIELYQILLQHYGKQYWWPADSKYEMIAGAILTQNTNWTNVTLALNNLKPYLNPNTILNMDNHILEELIKPAGFFKQKARYLKNIFTVINNDTIDHLFSLDTSSLRKKLLSIIGVGKETADSIILYAFNKPIFVIDTYTKRLLTKLGISNLKNYDAFQHYFESNTPKDVTLFNEFHALIVKYNKDIKTNNTDPLRGYILSI